jgi:hypothetical protein
VHDRNTSDPSFRAAEFLGNKKEKGVLPQPMSSPSVLPGTFDAPSCLFQSAMVMIGESLISEFQSKQIGSKLKGRGASVGIL